MANLIIALAAFAVLITGATAFASSWLSTASSNASAFLTAVEREGDIRRTHLAHIASCETPLGTTVRFQFANTGQTSLRNFGDWDITVFYQSDGSQLATRLSYTDAATPSGDEWTISQILQPDGQEEVIERDIINPGEEARIVIELSSAAWADSFNKLSISTDNGTTLEVGISGDNNCGYYLNNFPTPPSGDTASQTDLPLGIAFPSQPTLYNYDTDRDAQAGRLILKGGTGASESDVARHQNWLTPVLTDDLEINGTAIVDFWAALKDFDTALAGDVTVYLRDYDGASYTEIGNVTVSANPWDAGASGTFVIKSAEISGLNYTVAAGNQLEVKMIVGAGAGDDMWFAYDTLSYPSSITFTKTLRLLLHSEKTQIAGSTYYTIDDGNHNGGYYLHNNPSPPETTSVSQADLSATHTYPAATALFNYDTDRDSEAGRLIATGGSGAGETDLARYQNWLTPVLDEDLTVKGTVQVQLWAAMAGFDTANAGEVTVFLRDLTLGSYTELGNATLLVDPWDSTASGNWVKKLVEIEGVDATVKKGSQLEIKVIVGSGAAAAMLFAYDTTSFPTVVTLWDDTEAYPQGRPITLLADAGSSTGRFSLSPNSGRFVFPLDGYTSLSDSTWTVTYRVKKPRFGWIWFENAITYQVTTDNVWEDIDISAAVPAGTTGAIIEVVNRAPSNALAGFLKGKADTNDYAPGTQKIGGRGHRWQTVKVDSNGIILGYSEAAGNIDFNLIGYTVSGDPKYFDVPPSITPAAGTAGSWTTVDISAHVDADATGAILFLDSTGNDTIYNVREVGSTDNDLAHEIIGGSNNQYFVGLDELGKFEFYRALADIDVYLIGQTKTSLVFYSNDIVVADPALNSWQEIDADTYGVPDEANGLILRAANGGQKKNIGFRHGNSTDDGNKQFDRDEVKQATVGLNAANIWDEFLAIAAAEVAIAGYTISCENDSDIHADIDVQVRKANGEVRDILATHVAVTSNIADDVWSTNTGTFTPAAYDVVDPTDYLEIMLYAHVTRADSDCITIQFDVDDNSLSSSDQATISNVALFRE